MKRNPWPYAIIAYFVLFITALTIWIAYATHNDHQLVRKDYYEQELKFQNEIDSFARAATTGLHVSYKPANQLITVSLPTDATGTIHFYRPSNAKFDREIPIQSRDGVQTIDVRNFQPGLWKIRFSWTSQNAHYRHDETVFL